MHLLLTPRPSPRAWLWATLLGALAVAVHAVVDPPASRLMLAYPAVAAAALWVGAAPALLTALICVAGLLLMPAWAGHTPAPVHLLSVGVFVAASVAFACACAVWRRRAALRRAGSAAPPDADTGLAAWLRAVLWGAFLIPAAVFVIVAWWGFDRAERDAVASAARARDLVALHALRTFEIAEAIAARADAASSGPAELTRANEPAIHQRLSDMTAGLLSVLNLNVWDENGRAVVSSHIFPVDPHASNADRAYFLEHKNRTTVGLGISEVIKGRQLGTPLLNATIRRRTSDDRFEGIVAVSLSPDYFRDYYKSLATENHNLASFSLVRTDGKILARWPPAPDNRSEVAPDNPVLQRVVAGAPSGDLLLPSNTERDARYTSFTRVGTYPVYVMAGLSRRAMLGGWIRFVAILAAVLLPVTAGLAWVSWIALKKTRHEQSTAVELQEQIRRRASAEKSMLESQKLETLAVLTGGVAHDFNNLMAVVNASLHIHKRRHPEFANDKHLEAVSRAIQSGVRLTRQLLSFSRKQALRPEIVLLQDWLPATEQLIRSTLGASIRWRLEVNPDTRPICADLGELELALINLVVNAKHAMPQGGQLTISVGNATAAPTDRPGITMVSISVSDTGVGIPPEVLSRVFEAFFTTRERGVGSGLGLSQVRGFCTQAGGSAEIDSVVGQGTTVRMKLPASREAVVPAPATATAAPVVMNGRVLLVEDNDDVGRTTELVLRSAGLEVTRVVDADAALDHLRRVAQLPDAVLSDVAMPGSMNGIALAFALRRLHPALPVVLTTGYAEQLQEATAAGLRVLPKPLAPDTLLAELKAALDAAATTAAAGLR